MTDLLLLYTSPFWWLASLGEFGMFLLFARPLRPKRQGLAWLFLSDLLAFVVWHGVHLLHLDFVYDFCLNVILLTAFLRITRCETMVQSIYVSCIFCLCTEIGKITCVDLCLQPLVLWLAELPSLVVTAIWAFLCAGVTALCLAIVSRWMFGPGFGMLSRWQGLAILLPLLPYMLVRANEQVIADAGSDRLYWSMVALALASGVSTVVVIIANAHNLSAQLERNELLQMRALLGEQRAQFLAQREAEDSVRRQYHDLKYFLVGIESLCDSGGADFDRVRDDLARMRREIQAYDSRIDTGNETLDVLLAGKRNSCLANGITPVFYADAAHLSFMSSLDLCALFGNLLDNAIEAVERLPPGGDRSIYLDVRPEKGCSFIRVTNPFVGDVRPGPAGLAAGDLITTKPDTSEHGVGLKSVRMVVKHYDGSLALTAESGAFTASAIIPLPQIADPSVHTPAGALFGRACP